MASINCPLDETLYSLTLTHLGKLPEYVPGPVKKAGGTKERLQQRYARDPLYSIFGLDSPEYLAATLAGGTITSIHRKIGDIYEAAVKAVFMHQLSLTAEQLVYRADVQGETRSADVYLEFDQLEQQPRRRISTYCKNELTQLTKKPQLTLLGVGMEVRHCYQTGDSKRTQADEAMARHLLVSGVLPMMPLFCNQSNPTIINRYRTVWIIKEGMESYNMVKRFSDYDFYDFLVRNKEDFRKPVITLLRSLST